MRGLKSYHFECHYPLVLKLTNFYKYEWQWPRCQWRLLSLPIRCQWTNARIRWNLHHLKNALSRYSSIYCFGHFPCQYHHGPAISAAEGSTRWWGCADRNSTTNASEYSCPCHLASVSKNYVSDYLVLWCTFLSLSSFPFVTSSQKSPFSSKYTFRAFR